MIKEDYFSLHNKYEEEFKSYFKNNAEDYWKMYTLHYKNNISFDKLGMYFSCSKDTVRNRLEQIEEFLDNPEKFIVKENIDVLFMPNEFIHGYYSLSYNAERIFRMAINICQSKNNLNIPREKLLNLSPQYKNVNRRTIILDELRELKILLKNGDIITIFKSIEDCKGNIKFKFTSEAYDIIMPELFKYIPY